MITCPVCGQQNKPDRLEQPDFILSLCRDCGFASAITPNYPSGSHSATAVQAQSTGEVHLSPTAAYSVDELTEEGLENTGANTNAEVLTNVHVVSADPQLAIESLSQLRTQASLHLRRHIAGESMISQLVDRLANPGLSILVIESNFEAFPALELGFAVRAIETAFGIDRAPIIFVGDDNSDVVSGHQQLGESQIVIHSHRDGGQALIQLIKSYL